MTNIHISSNGAAPRFYPVSAQAEGEINGADTADSVILSGRSAGLKNFPLFQGNSIQKANQYIIIEKALRLAHLELRKKDQAMDAPSVTTGYLPEVQSIDPSQQHSMKDLQEYIADGFGKNTVRDMITNNRKIEIHVNNDFEVFHSLNQRGFTELYRIRTDNPAGHILLQAGNPETGEIRYILSHVIGKSQLLHNELQLRFMSYEGRQIDSANVAVYDHLGAGAEDIYRRNYMREISKSYSPGNVPSDAIIGYPRHIKSSLTRRAVASASMEALHKNLGEKPYEALMERLGHSGSEREAGQNREIVRRLKADKTIVEALSLSPKEIFSKSANLYKFQEAEKSLLAMRDLFPCSKALSSLFDKDHLKAEGISRPDECAAGRTHNSPYLRYQAFSYTDSTGSKRELMVTKNMMGDLSGILAATLADEGANRILFLGSAGGISPDSAVGGIRLPDNLFDEKGIKVHSGNDLLDFIRLNEQDPDDIRMGGNAGNVASPISETRDMIRNSRSSGIDSLECEMAHVSQALKGKEVRFSCANVITDLPSNGESLHEIRTINRNREDEAVDRIVDMLIPYYDIQKVDLEEGEAVNLVSREPSGFGVALRSLENLQKDYTIARIERKKDEKRSEGTKAAFHIADVILRAKNIEGPGYVLLRENLAEYFFNGVYPSEISKLAALSDPLSHLDDYVSERWRKKIIRDLSNPYTNNDVLAHMDDLGRQMAGPLNFIRDAARGEQYSLSLTGSFLKGRFSVNSDLDLVVRAKDKKLVRLAITSEHGHVGRIHPNDVAFADSGMVKTAILKREVPIGQGEDFLNGRMHLKDIYLKTLLSRGILLDEKTGSASLLPLHESHSFVKDANPAVEELWLAGNKIRTGEIRELKQLLPYARSAVLAAISHIGGPSGVAIARCLNKL